MAAPSVVRAGSDALPEADRLDAATRAATGHAGLDEAIRRDLVHPGRDSATFLAIEADRAIALCHVGRADNDGGAPWRLGVLVDPAAPVAPAVGLLLDAARAHVTDHGGGRADLWLSDPDDALDAAVGTHPGVRRDRALHQMRIELALDVPAVWPADVVVRDFDPARDAEAFVAVNNRAFAGHAEQGGWTVETLERRMAEPWFDPSLFLVALDPGGLCGFDWCKLHAATPPDPPLGEIYAIGVDPRAQGGGLGRALVVAGLDRLHRRGVDTGMLYVADDNVAAVALYQSLGFRIHRTDRAYTVDTGPPRPGAMT